VCSSIIAENKKVLNQKHMDQLTILTPKQNVVI
jgi:hypothetical protein